MPLLAPNAGDANEYAWSYVIRSTHQFMNASKLYPLKRDHWAWQTKV